MEAESPDRGSFHRTAKWLWLDSEWQGSGERGKFCTGFVPAAGRLGAMKGRPLEAGQAMKYPSIKRCLQGGPSRASAMHVGAWVF